MERVHRLSDQSHDLQAGYVAIEHIANRRIPRIANRKQGGHQHSRGMRLGRIEIVIEIERVSRCSIQ